MEKFVTVSMTYRRVAAIAVLSAGFLTLPCALLAQNSLRDLSRVSTSGNFQEAGMRNPGSLYLIIGALIAVIIVGGFFFYQERCFLFHG